MQPRILISIVIPIYNVENYISQCLDSVYAQNIPEHNYEVICVDDFSPDKSKEIVREYQKKHTNLMLIEHASNKKLGPARNTGRSVAQGKYIWNIDSDDYVKPNVLKYLLEICEENDLDVLMFNFDHLPNSTEKLNQNFPFENSPVLTGIDFINKYCLNNFGEISPIWTQMYRKEFLDQKGIYSPPINMGEDVPFTLKGLLMAKRIMSITKSCYVYRTNQNSLGGIIEIKPNAIKVYEKCFACTRYIYEITKLIPKEEIAIKKSYLNVCKYIISLYPNYVRNFNKQELQKFRNLCRRHFWKDIKILLLLGNRKRFTYLSTIIIPLIKIR
jgi:glycosyltransferase involved in cell wall biosynthesis